MRTRLGPLGMDRFNNDMAKNIFVLGSLTSVGEKGPARRSGAKSSQLNPIEENKSRSDRFRPIYLDRSNMGSDEVLIYEPYGNEAPSCYLDTHPEEKRHGREMGRE